MAGLDLLFFILTAVLARKGLYHEMHAAFLNNLRIYTQGAGKE
jgi:hypothetical protein